MKPLIILEDDRFIWETELNEFVPNRIFDAHTHFYDTRLMSKADHEKYAFMQACPRVGLAELRQLSAMIFPNRELHSLASGMPRRSTDLAATDAMVGEQVTMDPLSIGLMLAHPRLSRAEVEKQLDRTGLHGFKPYMCFSTSPDPSQSTILEMLPEYYWQIANDRALIILLHMGRHASLADPVNQRDIRKLCERYPGARLQLAHCARCFTSQIAETGLPTVADLPNVHVDTSAVCETEVFHILLDVWPRERILFGTDNCVAGLMRGKYAGFGKGWYGIFDSNTTAFQAPHVPFPPTFVAYENLRALRMAVRRKGWGKSEIEDLFWNNAQRILFRVG